MNKNMIGRNIRLLRTYFGYSRQQLAQRSGISERTIFNYERNLFSPQPDKIAKIEQAFNVQLDTVELVYQPRK